MCLFVFVFPRFFLRFLVVVVVAVAVAAAVVVTSHLLFTISWAKLVACRTFVCFFTTVYAHRP